MTHEPRSTNAQLYVEATPQLGAVMAFRRRTRDCGLGHVNILITGPCGAGKSWLACALAHQACRDGFSALYLRIPRLLHDLAVARADGSYAKLLASLAKLDLIVLDDFGLAKLNPDNRRDLLELLEDRYATRSTLVTSQLPIENWHDALGDPTFADAILDRLVHNAYKLKLKEDRCGSAAPDSGAARSIPVPVASPFRYWFAAVAPGVSVRGAARGDGGWFLTLIGAYRILGRLHQRYFSDQASPLRDVRPHGATQGGVFAIGPASLRGAGRTTRSRMTHEQRAGHRKAPLPHRGEAGSGRGDAEHAQRRRRQASVLHPERPVAGAEASVAPLAVIPGALERQRAQRGGEGLGPAPGEACLGAARAGQMRSLLVAVVGVEPSGERLPHELQRHPTGFGLDRLEVIHDALADQPLDLGLDLLRDRRVQTPFFPAWPVGPRPALHHISGR